MMKIGFIFECGPQGADKQVCEYLASQLRPGMKLISRTLDNKPNLLAEAGKVAAMLLADGCHCVLIIWDLRPAWPNKVNKPCRHGERQALLQALTQAGIAVPGPVYLVCIEQELESWLLADESLVSKYLSTPQHAVDIKRVRHPDREQQPKAKLNNYFQQSRGWRYDDKVHAIKILRAGTLDVTRMRRSNSFVRFENKLMDCATPS